MPKTLKNINCEFKGCFNGKCCITDIKKCPVKVYDELLKKEAKEWKNSDITLNEFIDKFFA